MLKKKNKRKDAIISICVSVFLVAMLLFSGFYIYKYYNYPSYDLRHCYAHNDSENLDIYYTLEDDTIIRKVEVLSYPYTEEKYTELNNSFDESKNGKYSGYMQKLWYDENEIVKMRLYDFKRLSRNDAKELLGVNNLDKYLTGQEDTYALECKNGTVR